MPEALPVSPVALRPEGRNSRLRHRNGRTRTRCMVLRAEPIWPYDPTVLLPVRRPLRVVAGVSPLAVWEQLVADRDELPWWS